MTVTCAACAAHTDLYCLILPVPQDIEFTVQEGRLYMLQCRGGKRTGAAAVKIAVDMVDEGLVTEDRAVLMVGFGFWALVWFGLVGTSLAFGACSCFPGCIPVHGLAISERSMHSAPATLSPNA